MSFKISQQKIGSEIRSDLKLIWDSIASISIRFVYRTAKHYYCSVLSFLFFFFMGPSTYLDKVQHHGGHLVITSGHKSKMTNGHGRKITNHMSKCLFSLILSFFFVGFFCCVPHPAPSPPTSFPSCMSWLR